MKKKALRGMIVLAIVVALCMFFSGTVRTITTPKVRFTSARQGKFEQVTELTGKITFTDAEDVALTVPDGASLTVKSVFVRAGSHVEAGDKLISAVIDDYDKTVKNLQKSYDEAEASLRDLVRKNGEVRLTRNETAWMEAYYAAQTASQLRRDCQVDVMALLSLEGLELTESGSAPEGASEELIAAVAALTEAEAASDEANAALEKLNRYAIADDTWTYINQRRTYEAAMTECEEKLTRLALLSMEMQQVTAPHAGYITEVLVEKNGSAQDGTVIVKITPEDGAPVIRADITDVKQSVAAGALVTIDTSRYGRVETNVTGTGVLPDGTRYADVTVNNDMMNGSGGLNSMMQGDITLRLSTRAQESSCLVSAAAVRGTEGDRYVYVTEKQSSTFGGTQLKVVKQSVTVLGETESVVSVSEDLTRSQIIYMEDRAIKEGDTVMEYST